MLVSNKKTILKILILFFLLISILDINTFAIVNQTKEFYVNDYANLINADTKEYIINTNLNLYNQTGAQIVVVTVQNLEGKSIEEYATELFRKFGIGDSSKDNGVLMLLALDEREFRIEVGYGLEGALPDGKTGRIQDQYIIPYLSQNSWNEGIKNGYNAIIQEVANEYGVEVNSNEPLEYISNSEQDATIFIPILFILIIYLIIFIKIKNNGTINISYGGSSNYSRNRSFLSRTSSSSRSSSRSRSSFGGGGSSGGGGSTRRF